VLCEGSLKFPIISDLINVPPPFPHLLNQNSNIEIDSIEVLDEKEEKEEKEYSHVAAVNSNNSNPSQPARAVPLQFRRNRQSERIPHFLRPSSHQIPPPPPPPPLSDHEANPHREVKEIVYSYTKLIQKIPKDCEPLFIKLVRPALTKLFDELGNINTSSLKEFMSIPKRNLRSPCGNSFKAARLFKQHLANVVSADSSEFAVSESNANFSRNGTKQSKSIKGMNSAIEAAKNGYIQRAVNLAGRNNVEIELNEETMTQVRRLHPEGSGKSFPDIPVDSPFTMDIDKEILIRLLASMDNGSSPGISGWSINFIRVLMKDETCANAIIMLLKKIKNGQIEENVKHLFLQSSLVLIPNKHKIRPIAMGEVFLKIAWKLTFKLLPDAKTLFPSGIQKGLGHPGGSATAVHSFQTALEAGAKYLHVGFASDFANAFGCLERSKMGEVFFANKHLEQANRLFNFCYSKPTDLILHNGAKIQSKSGSRQGCSGGSLGYCVTVDPIYTEVKNAGGNITANAIIDDFSIVGSVENTIQAVRKLIELSAKEGLPLELSKCRWLWPHEEPVPPELSAFVDEFGMRIERGAMELHGSAVGLDENKRREIIQSQIQQNQKIFEFLNHESFPNQLVPLILRASTLHKCQYITQSSPPSINFLPLRNFGRRVIETFTSKILDGKIDEEGKFLLQTPIRLGGWGLTCPSVSSPASFISSYLRATVSTNNFNNLITSRNLEGNAELIPITEEIKSIIEVFKEKLAKSESVLEMLPAIDNVTGLLKPSPNHNKMLQKVINDGIADLYSEDKIKHSTSLKIRIDDLKTVYARKFHSIRPTHERFKLSDVDYQFVARNLLNQPPSNNTPEFCICGQSMKDRPDHLQVCRLTRSTFIQGRHNAIRGEIGQLTELVGGIYNREVSSNSRDGKRIDGICHISSGSYSHDVSVVHANSPSYVKQNICHEKSSDTRNTVKNKKYFQDEAALSRKFCAFILTSYGSFNKSAIALLSQLSKEAEIMTSQQEQEFFNMAINRILIVLHKSNAKISQLGLVSIRKHEDSHSFENLMDSDLVCDICCETKSQEQFDYIIEGCRCLNQKCCFTCLTKTVFEVSSKCSLCGFERTQISFQPGLSKNVLIEIPHLRGRGDDLALSEAEAQRLQFEELL
jgi:hypothetical protein